MTSPLWPVSRGGDKGLEISWETQRQDSISDLRPTSSQSSASFFLFVPRLNAEQIAMSLCFLFNHVNNFCSVLIIGGDNNS